MKGGILICLIKGIRDIKYEDLNYGNTENQNHAENYIWRLVENENFGRRSFFNGDKKKQYYGLLAQAVICYKLRRPIPAPGGFDNGVDLILNNKLIDIKTTIRTVDFRDTYAINLLDCQYRENIYKNDYYLFCSFNTQKNSLEILGILKKEDVEKKGKYFSKNDKSINASGKQIEADVERWEFRLSDLIPVNSIEDIVNYFK